MPYLCKKFVLTKCQTLCVPSITLFRVMIAKREYKNINTATADGIDHTMFVSYSAAPFAVFALQWLRLSYTRKRMFFDILQQFCYALHNALIACLNPVLFVLSGLFQKYYFHRSSMAIVLKLPSAISFSPSRRISTIFGDEFMWKCFRFL